MKTLQIAALLALSQVSAPALAFNGGGEEGADGFVRLPELTVPILDDYRMEGVLSVTFVVQTEDARVRERFALRKPAAIDVYGRALTEFARIWVDASRPVDVGRLAGALDDASKEFAPACGCKVFVQEVVVRRR